MHTSHLRWILGKDVKAITSNPIRRYILISIFIIFIFLILINHHFSNRYPRTATPWDLVSACRGRAQKMRKARTAMTIAVPIC